MIRELFVRLVPDRYLTAAARLGGPGVTVDTRISGGSVVLPTEVVDADVLIDGDRIAGLVDPGTEHQAETVVDASDRLVLPGVVDPHTHIADYNTVDSYETASAAAALGGVTSLLTFAWQAWEGEESPYDEPGTLREAVERHHDRSEASYVDHGVHAVITREDPETLRELEDVRERGVTSIKLFTTYESGVSYGFLDEAFDAIAEAGLVAAVHTEDDAICTRRTEQAIDAGAEAPESYPGARPDYAEAIAADATARLAAEHGVNYYGVHTTSRAAVEALAPYTDQANVRAETCTHYTAVDERLYGEMGALPVLAPPLRQQDDIEALFDHLADGTLSVVSTDHVATMRAQKTDTPWWDGPYGVNSLQRSLPVFHDVAVNERGFSYPFLARVMSENPARTFGMARKGRIAPGMDADLVVFDPAERHTISAANNASNADFSIYEGREVTGTVKQTFVRGTLVADGDTVVASPGHGEYLHREVPAWTDDDPTAGGPVADGWGDE